MHLETNEQISVLSPRTVRARPERPVRELHDADVNAAL
jgi:hypothetical protein